MSLQVWYFSTPDAVPNVDTLPENELPEVAVVVDVLRATTTIAKLLEQGAEAVETFEDVAACRKAASDHPNGNALLVGERQGIMIEGFDLGNSPVAVTKDVVEAKRVFMSTTNGTRALAKVRSVGYVFCAALPNRAAVAREVMRVMGQVHVQPNETSHVWIVGSGGEGKFSLEDTLCAGATAAALMEQCEPSIVDFEINFANDDMTAALCVWECYKDRTEMCLRKASHGKRLTEIMSQQNADADFQACAALDTCPVVPEQTNPGVLRRAPQHDSAARKRSH